MNCAPPVTSEHRTPSTELGRFLLHLFQQKKRTYYCSELLQFLKSTPLSLEDYPKVERSYSRTIVAKVEEGFEGMVARWDEGIAGAVHGHPDYAFYHLLHGRLGVEDFSLGNSGPELVSFSIIEPGQHFCIEGVAGRRDNAIHRISVLEESLSVHMYSEDALLGRCFFDYPELSPFLTKSTESLLQ